MNLLTGFDYAMFKGYTQYLNEVKGSNVFIKIFTSKDGMELLMLKVPTIKFSEKYMGEDNTSHPERKYESLGEPFRFIEISDKEFSIITTNNNIIYE